MHTLHQGVSIQAHRRPEATAVVWHGKHTSYAELETTSSRLARLLSASGCGRGDRVAILMPKMPMAIIAMLGEVEAVLGSLPELSESAVTVIDSCSFERTLICCAYAPARGVSISPAAIRAQLAAVLPRHMLPVRWKRYESLPRNGNGKIDRPLIRTTFARNEIVGDGQRITALRSTAVHSASAPPAADLR